MWPKDDYQEHMLGYIDGVRSEFEQLIHAHIQQQHLNDFYTNLEIAFECLWRLNGASDADWEGFRYPLEARCDELLRALRPLPNANSLALSGVSFQPFNASVLLGTVRRQRDGTEKKWEADRFSTNLQNTGLSRIL